MRRFELAEGTSAKFWEVSVEGAVLRTRHGRLGSAGQTNEKSASSESDALAALEKLVAEKLRKGYREVGAEAPAAPTAPPAAASPEKVGKRPKAPRKSAPEYQAVVAAFGAILGALDSEEPPPVDALLGELDAVLAHAAAPLVLDAEAALWSLAERRLDRSISSDATLVKVFAGDPPEQLAAARAHHDGLRAAQAACVELKHRALVRMLEAGCDPFVIAKREYYTPLECFVRSLPLQSNDEVFAYPWSQAAGRVSALEVLEAFAARGDTGREAPPGRATERGCEALGDAAGRWPVFEALLARASDAPTSLLAWHGLARVAPHRDPARVERLAPLARHLVAIGAAGLVAGGRPGAMLLALTTSSPDALEALLEAGASLDERSVAVVKGTIHVATKLLPPERDGDRQNRELRVAAGLTVRDVADAVLARYDVWEATLGDREGVAFGTFGHARREAHARARTLATALAERGAAVSGRRRPERLSEAVSLPVDFKPRVDAGLCALAGRLGVDDARTTAACDAVAPSFAPHSAQLGAAWIGELLGYSDAQLGPDPDVLDAYDAEAREALRSGTWLGTRADAAAVLTRSGSVVETSIRGGVRPLAKDLASFVEADLACVGTIVA